MRWAFLIAVAALHVSANDLGSITVEGEASKEGLYSQKAFEGVFGTPEIMEFEHDVQGAPAAKVLSTKEALFMPGVQGDPIKAVKFLGGVSSVGDGNGELYLYASKPEESLYTINHLPLGYLYHGFGIHSVLAPDAIAQINAYLAGFDASYGNALGGVIDITPQYPKGNNSAYVHAGIYDASFGMDVGLSDDVSLYLGGRRSYYDLMLDAVGKSTGTLDKDSNTTYTQFPNYYDITALLGYTYDSSNYLSLEFVTAADSLTINTTNNAVKDPEAVGEIDSSQSFVTVGARHQGYYGHYRTHSLIYWTQSKSKAQFFKDYYVDNILERTGVYHQSTLDWNQHRFMAGVEATQFHIPLDMYISKPPSSDDVDYDFTCAPKYRINQNYDFLSGTLFLQDVYEPTPEWSVRYGTRIGVSDYNNLGVYVDPRAAVVYNFKNNSHLSISGGRYTHTPSGIKLIKDLGNPDIDYERAWHLLLHGDTPLGNNGTLSLEPFYKKYEALAISDKSLVYDNTGEGYAYGFDLSAKWRSDEWYFFGAYTYIQSRRQLSSEDTKQYRFYAEIPHTLQLLGSWHFAPTWALSMLAKYNSGIPYTPVIGTYESDCSGEARIRPIYGEPFSKRLNDYFTLNLKIAQEIKLEGDTKLEWSFELMNATNNENRSDILYEDDYSIKGYVTQLPLLPWLDITYRF